ncbi:MAG: rod shape-determining protein, partial [Muribaculaceae bacterium]|nr:rod shape-determining protein [Muribaculaceae bacterium]
STQRRLNQLLPDETEITPEIVEELLGRAVSNVDADREVVKVAPGEFRVDSMEAENPVGTIGSSISADVGVISCRQQMIRNISLAISDKLGLRINGKVVRHVAIADMCLTSDERERGVMLVDFGAETTTVSIYKGGYLRSLVTLPLGSRHITRDIMSRNFSEERAEEHKKAIGNAILQSPEAARMRNAGVDDSEINCYVAARAGEIVVNILERVNEIGLTPHDLPAGIVLTGGGARLTNFDVLLSDQSGLDVRRATIPASVRRSSNKLQLPDHIDVVAVLHSLASQATRECVSVPAPSVETANPPVADNSNDPDLVVENVSGRRSGRSLFSPFRKFVSEILNPADDDDSEEDFTAEN